MKLTINAPLYNLAVNRIQAVIGFAVHFASQNSIINKSNDKMDAQNAEMFKKPVEEVRKARILRKTESVAKTLAKFVPLADKEFKESKIFTWSKSEDNQELSVEIKDEFLVDQIEAMYDFVAKSLQALVEFSAQSKAYSDAIEELRTKWIPEPEVVMEVKVVPHEEVPKEIKAQVSVNIDGWDLVLAKNPLTSVPFFIDDAKEDFIEIVDLMCTKDDKVFTAYPLQSHNILSKTDKTVEELAESYSKPASLIIALHKYYNREVPKRSTAV